MRVGILAGVLIAISCGDTAREWAGSVEVLEDGTRVVRNPAVGLASPEDEPLWVLEEELRIGREDGDGADVFGSIGGLYVGDGGAIHVIETQAREVRVFSPSGEVLGTLGGPGSGPGEFRSPTGVFGDASGMTWVVDGMASRYTRFDSAGAVLETRPRPSRALGGGPFLGGITTDGVVYDTDLDVPPESEDMPPLLLAAGMGGSRLILRAMFAMDGRAVTDTVDLPAMTAERVTFRAPGMMIGSPFNPRLHTTFDARGAVWWGESDAYRIHRRSLNGDTLTRIERAYEAVPVRAEEVDQWLASENVATFRSRGGQADASALQGVKPVFDGLVVDDEGYLWVRLITGSGEPRFDVFDGEGRFLGWVAGSEEMSAQAPVIVGDRFHAVIRGNYDVPYVVRYRIRGRTR